MRRCGRKSRPFSAVKTLPPVLFAFPHEPMATEVRLQGVIAVVKIWLKYIYVRQERAKYLISGGAKATWIPFFILKRQLKCLLRDGLIVKAARSPLVQFGHFGLCSCELAIWKLKM